VSFATAGCCSELVLCAGFGSALALAKAGAEVTLLDAAESPGGLSSTFKSAKGQVVEPGVKGFWYQVRLSSCLTQANVCLKAGMACRHDVT
jgi:protoporphyrinogen oxidase